MWFIDIFFSTLAYLGVEGFIVVSVLLVTSLILGSILVHDDLEQQRNLVPRSRPETVIRTGLGAERGQRAGLRAWD